MRAHSKAVAMVAMIPQLAQALDLDVTNSGSIKDAASTIAYGMVKYYTGNDTNTPETIGILPQPYYWWEAGAMWGALLDYYHFTGDSTYNDVTTQGLLSQVGPDYDYMAPLHQKDEGNDDQAFWGFATMSAAEQGYPEPSAGGYTWLELTENLWNTQVRRWDTSTCGGGLRWQIFTFNNGYDYKNSVSNGAFFQLSARLARFTGNQTYVDWAEKSLKWSQDVGLISQDWRVYDGTDDTQNCANMDLVQWTYNAGIYLYGSAIMYDYTNGASEWETRTQGFLSTVTHFFSPFPNSTNIMFEPACETINTCNNDEYSFKAYLSRFMWATTLMAPFTKPTITPLLQKSSSAAAQSCSGGDDGVTCGQHWYYGGYDGRYGVGQQLSALETIQGMLIGSAAPPLRGDQVIQAAPTTSETPETTSTTPAPTSTQPPSTQSETISSSSSTSSSESEAPTLTSQVPTTLTSSHSTSLSTSSLSSTTITGGPSSTLSSTTLSSVSTHSSTTLIGGPSSTLLSTLPSSIPTYSLSTSTRPSSIASVSPSMATLSSSSTTMQSTTDSDISVVSETASPTPSPTPTEKPNAAGKTVERASWLMGIAVGLAMMFAV